jgi:hypothetical protein
MSTARLDGLSPRRVFEFVLAVVLLILSSGVVLQPSLLLDRPFRVDSLWMFLLMLLPLALGVSVLYGVFSYWFQVGLSVFGDSDTDIDRSMLSSRLVMSLVFCILGVQTLWGVAGTYYSFVSSSSAGILAAPLIALLSGTLLGVLIIVQALLSRLFPESDVAKLRESMRSNP